METGLIEQTELDGQTDDALSHLKTALEAMEDRLPAESILQEATGLKRLLELINGRYLGSDNEAEKALMAYESLLDSIAMLVFFLTGDPRAVSDK